MKKLIAMLLALLTICSFASCGGTEGKTDMDNENSKRDDVEDEEDDDDKDDKDDKDGKDDHGDQGDKDNDVEIDREEILAQMADCYLKFQTVHSLRAVVKEDIKVIRGEDEPVITNITDTFAVSGKNGLSASITEKHVEDGIKSPEMALYYTDDAVYFLENNEVSAWEEENDTESFLYNNILAFITDEDIETVAERMAEKDLIITEEDGLITVRFDGTFLEIMEVLNTEESYEAGLEELQDDLRGEGFFSISFTKRYINRIQIFFSMQYTSDEGVAISMDTDKIATFYDYNKDITVQVPDWVTEYEGDDDYDTDYPYEIPEGYSLYENGGLYYILPEEWVYEDEMFISENGSSFNVQIDEDETLIDEINLEWFENELAPELEAQGYTVENPEIGWYDTDDMKDVLVLTYDMTVDGIEIAMAQFLVARPDCSYVFTFGIMPEDPVEVCVMFLEYMVYIG